jgi:hypothetical protein
MALGWMTVLKLVPWAELIEATPKIVKAAQHLMGQVRKSAKPQPVPPAPLASDAPEALHNLQQRVYQLELAQQESAAVIESLAEQNAKLVQVVEMLGKNQQRLRRGLWILAAVVVGLVVWAVRS